MTFPRSNERGSIEANEMITEPHDARAGFHVRMNVAQLKPQSNLHFRASKKGFHVRMNVAQLKRGFITCKGCARGVVSTFE